jgi:hypothetical protein
MCAKACEVPLMTEAEWLSGTDPEALVKFVGDRSERKLKLFGCACCRRVWTVFRDERSRHAVEVTERSLEGAMNLDELLTVYSDAADAMIEATQVVAEWAAYGLGDSGWKEVAFVARSMSVAWADAFVGREGARATIYRNREHVRSEEQMAQCELVRDIFGDPFRPVEFSTDWHTDTTVSLARQMYDSREFSAMPILADALQDAGCDDDAILSHCRDENRVHIRGCWVVDLVLNRS